jgi:twitching motility protein PilT
MAETRNPPVDDPDKLVSELHLISSQERSASIASGEAVDIGFTLKGLGRFRMNLHRERGRPAAAIRALPIRVPRVVDLHFSHDISLLAELPRVSSSSAGQPDQARPQHSRPSSPKSTARMPATS